MTTVRAGRAVGQRSHTGGQRRNGGRRGAPNVMAMMYSTKTTPTGLACTNRKDCSVVKDTVHSG